MAIINVEKAVRLMDGDQELFADLFDVIEASLPEKYANVEAALKNESREDLELYAHQFKGALRNVAAEEACAVLEKLEKCGVRGDFVEGRVLYAGVKPLVDQVFEFFRSRAWVAAFQKR